MKASNKDKNTLCDGQARLTKGRRDISQRILLLTTLIVAIAGSDITIRSLSAQTTDRERVLAPHDPAHAAESGIWCAVHVGKKELVQVLSDCTYALALNPRDVQALSNRAALYLIARDPEAALADFDRAIALQPGVATLHFNRGVAHADLGNAQAAMADYTEAICLQREFDAALHNRGYEFEKRGDTQHAIADYEAALRIKPDLNPSLKRLEGCGAACKQGAHLQLTHLISMIARNNALLCKVQSLAMPSACLSFYRTAGASTAVVTSRMLQPFTSA